MSFIFLAMSEPVVGHRYNNYGGTVMPKRNYIDSPRPYSSASGAPLAVQFWDRIYRDRGYWLDWLVFQASIQYHDQWLARNRNPLPLEVRSKQLWQILLCAALGENPNPFRQLHCDFVLAIPRSEQSAFLLAYLQGCLILSGLDEQEAQRCLVQFLHQRPGGIVNNQMQLRPDGNMIVAIDLLGKQSLVQPGVILPWTNDLSDYDACGIPLRAPTRYVRNELWYGGFETEEKTAVEAQEFGESIQNNRPQDQSIDEQELCKLLVELHRFSQQVGLLEVSSGTSAAAENNKHHEHSIHSDFHPKKCSLSTSNASVASSTDQIEIVLLWDRVFLRQDFAQEWCALRDNLSEVLKKVSLCASKLCIEPDPQLQQNFWIYFCDLALAHVESLPEISPEKNSEALLPQVKDIFVTSGVTIQIAELLSDLTINKRELIALWFMVGRKMAQGMRQEDAFIDATEISFTDLFE